ncbi:hypothetical protein [Parasitella parasitica]|uniref:Uncharacterized protein n=1 Tax=Parasitella parasitica TaxID=35722 RepID=A0A0B7N7Y4_9FUNG|nr:hypothetical protein [Parasitella parasitica]
MAQCDLVSSSTMEPDALRVELIWQKLSRQQLNAQAVEGILAQRLVNTATNKLYWFSPSDVVNFLADMRQANNLQASTLKTLRAALAYLQDNPSIISDSELINYYLDTLMRQAPPVSIHRTAIDISPALAYARTIASRPSTTVKLLQQKLAFVMAMAAFLRPSDLVRIPFASCTILDNGRLRFQAVSPKETRGKRGIIKPFTLHPHAGDYELCPIQCFKAIRDHPALQARPRDANLFVKSNLITQTLSASTASTWFHRDFISLCTSEPGVSIRALASSRALDLGIS